MVIMLGGIFDALEGVRSIQLHHMDHNCIEHSAIGKYLWITYERSTIDEMVAMSDQDIVISGSYKLHPTIKAVVFDREDEIDGYPRPSYKDGGKIEFTLFYEVSKVD